MKNLLKYFKDEKIGAVNSTISDTKNTMRISFLRCISNTICHYESRSGSSLNIHGALYAQRRSLFRAFPENILHDDLFAVVSTLIQDKRLIQADDVVIYDMPFDNYYNKSRLERLVRGLMLFMLHQWPSIRQMPKTILVRFLIYKYLKILLPLLLLGIILPLLYFSQTRTLCISVMLGMLPLLIIYPEARRTFFTLLKASFYFTGAIFKFFVLKKRESGWEKPLTTKTLTLSQRG